MSKGGKVTAECQLALSNRDADDVRSEQSSRSLGGSTHTTCSTRICFSLYDGVKID